MINDGIADPITHVLNLETGNRESCEQILRSKYPAKSHARRVAEWIVKNGGDANGVIYLESQKTRMNEVCSIPFYTEIQVNESAG